MNNLPKFLTNPWTKDGMPEGVNEEDYRAEVERRLRENLSWYVGDDLTNLQFAQGMLKRLMNGSLIAMFYNRLRMMLRLGEEIAPEGSERAEEVWEKLAAIYELMVMTCECALRESLVAAVEERSAQARRPREEEEGEGRCRDKRVRDRLAVFDQTDPSMTFTKRCMATGERLGGIPWQTIRDDMNHAISKGWLAARKRKRTTRG